MSSCFASGREAEREEKIGMPPYVRKHVLTRKAFMDFIRLHFFLQIPKWPFVMDGAVLTTPTRFLIVYNPQTSPSKMSLLMMDKVV